MELIAIEWVDIHQFSGWIEEEQKPPSSFVSVGWIRSEDDDWLVLTDTSPVGNATWYPKGCIRKRWVLSTKRIDKWLEKRAGPSKAPS